MLWNMKHVLKSEDRFEKLTSDAYATALENTWFSDMMSERPGKGKRHVFEWLLATSGIRDLKPGETRFDDLVTQAHEVEHKDRGAALQVFRSQWEDDDMDFASDWATQMGSEMALDPQTAATELLLNATVGKSYDGVSFLHASHPVNPKNAGAGVYRNLVTNADQVGMVSANLLVSTEILTKDLLAAGIAHVKGFRMPNKRNRNLKVTRLVCGPKTETKALELTSAGFIGATENVMTRYRIEPLVINEITSTGFGLVCQRGETPGLLPFVRSIRRPYEMSSYNGMSDSELARAKRLEWHVFGRYGHCYGHPYQLTWFGNLS